MIGAIRLRRSGVDIGGPSAARMRGRARPERRRWSTMGPMTPLGGGERPASGPDHATVSVLPIRFRSSAGTASQHA